MFHPLIYTYYIKYEKGMNQMKNQTNVTKNLKERVNPDGNLTIRT